MQSVFVGSSDELQAAVLESGVFEGQPEPDGRFRLGAEVGSVLVRRDFPTNARILENVHALSHRWSLEAQLPAKFTDSVVEGVLPEDRMFGGQSMTDLVQRELFGHQQLVVASDGTSLEEVADFVARLDEILFAILEFTKTRFLSTRIKRRSLLTCDDSASVVEKIFRSSLGACEHMAFPAFSISFTSAGLKKSSNVM